MQKRTSTVFMTSFYCFKACKGEGVCIPLCGNIPLGGNIFYK